METYIDQVNGIGMVFKNSIEQYNKNKNLNEVDAVTGATWSYNIFKDTQLMQYLSKQKK
jgi:major membrane immunogen (membrane-anchored lipoprotein)